MAHYVEARYDAEDGTFLPPLRTLGLNPQLKMNDSLLVQSYIEAYDISYPEALRRIEAEVAEVRQHLDAKGEYELNDIGTLRLNEEGNLIFEPCEAGILTPALYGLSSFEMQPLSIEEEPETPQETALETVSEEDGAITIKMSWLRNVAAVAAAVVAFLMISVPISNSDTTDVQQSAFIPISTPHATHHAEDAIVMDTTALQVATSDLNITSETSVEQKEMTTSKEASAAPTYCIVLASQVNRKNATNFIDILKDQGFGDARLMETKFLRVVYGSYASEEEAHQSLLELRSQSRHFREAWVMKVNQ
jgi:cell division septation protein DedD